MLKYGRDYASTLIRMVLDYFAKPNLGSFLGTSAIQPDCSARTLLADSQTKPTMASINVPVLVDYYHHPSKYEAVSNNYI